MIGEGKGTSGPDRRAGETRKGMAAGEKETGEAVAAGDI